MIVNSGTIKDNAYGNKYVLPIQFLCVIQEREMNKNTSYNSFIKGASFNISKVSIVSIVFEILFCMQSTTSYMQPV